MLINFLICYHNNKKLGLAANNYNLKCIKVIIETMDRNW